MTKSPEIPSSPASPVSPTPLSSRGVAKTVYFSDKIAIDNLQAALKKYPRTSLSNFMTQMVQQAHMALQQLPASERKLVIGEMVVWL